MARVMMITGASSGIGAATARKSVEAGWQVALLARSAQLDGLVGELGAAAAAFPCDVADHDAQVAATRKVLERFGRIDAVFANAGRGGAPGGFSEAPVDSWKALMDVNVLGVAYTVRASLPALRESRGHIVLTGSVAGRRTLAGSMYSVSKWAVTAIGYNLREELRGTGVRVTVLEPGMVDTPFFDAPKPDALKPEDIAEAVLYAVAQPARVDVHELLVLPTPPVED